MIQRQAIKELQLLMAQFPCVVILGSRQTGKTTLAKALATKSKKQVLYLDLERESHFFRLNEDPESYLIKHQDKTIIIDEIQRMPRLFALLRALIDMKRKPARFVITGSASPNLVKGVSESLAGRAAYYDLGGITLPEAAKAKINLENHWFRGGFPEALTYKSEAPVLQWRKHFIKSYIEKELSELFGIEFTQDITKRFWKMLAHSSGNLYNAELFARSLGVTGPTVNRYLNYMEGAFLLTRLNPWFSNAKKRLVKSQKVYITDSGILHGLLDIDSYDDLLSHPVAGASWEGYVVEQIIRLKPDPLSVYFYRTQHGAECDLVFVKGNKAIASVEIKLSTSPNISKGFHECIDDLRTKHNYIIVPSGDAFPLRDKIWCYSLAEFLKDILPNLK